MSKELLKTLAYAELEKIEYNPVEYFPAVPTRYAFEVQNALSELTNEQFESFSKSRDVLIDVEDNYSFADDTGHDTSISFEVITNVLSPNGYV